MLFIHFQVNVCVPVVGTTTNLAIVAASLTSSSTCTAKTALKLCVFSHK